jgi:hypothetical protein
VSPGFFFQTIMSAIDQIIAILGPPQSRAEQDSLAKLAENENKILEDLYVERVPALVDALTQTDEQGRARLDRFFSEIMGAEVLVRNPIPTFFEKKGKRHPAIMFTTVDIVDERSESQIDRVSEIFRTEAAKSELARKLGMDLRLEAVEVFVTFR